MIILLFLSYSWYLDAHGWLHYQDCLYRNMYKYDLYNVVITIPNISCFRFDYIAVLDWDDLIMPLQHNTWDEMIQNISRYSGNVTSFNFKNYYYLEEVMSKEDYEQDIPQYLHMMQHVYR